jgi:hypothetical protein
MASSMRRPMAGQSTQRAGRVLADPSAVVYQQSRLPAGINYCMNDPHEVREVTVNASVSVVLLSRHDSSRADPRARFSVDRGFGSLQLLVQCPLHVLEPSVRILRFALLMWARDSRNQYIPLSVRIMIRANVSVVWKESAAADASTPGLSTNIAECATGTNLCLSLIPRGHFFGLGSCSNMTRYVKPTHLPRRP